jgi:3-deoxy-manno-octulosonate cytidylyltransferase (CMP-KDO synthetase)
MSTIGIIPARYASTRFPGKPLTMIRNKPMIRHVWEQAIKSKLDKVVVATDDERIERSVIEFGGLAIMTSPAHGSGTERCAEVLQKLKKTNQDIEVVINIQGDEPFIDPQQIDLVISCFLEESVQIATLAKKIDRLEEINDPNVVKVVFDINDRALYFSRQAIPYIREQNKANVQMANYHFKHIGIYGYRAPTLKKIVTLKKSPLETLEGLEQLRWIENGYSIKVHETDIESIGIDVPEDLSKI